MNQLDEYNQIWKRYGESSEAILNDIPSLRNSDTSPDYSLTFTLILPSEMQQKLFDLSEQIKASFPEHHYLPVNYYHISLSYLSTYNKDEDPILIRKKIEKYKEFLSEKVPTFSSISLKIKGLNHFGNCVFAQVWDKDGTLFALNEKIQKEFQIQNKFPFVPHIAIIYYKKDPQKLFEFIDSKLRDVEISKGIISTASLLKWSLHRENDNQAYEILGQKSLK